MIKKRSTERFMFGFTCMHDESKRVCLAQTWFKPDSTYTE
ncbi:hypothetical protein DLH88_08885 [Vibrio parahaemolyticus]|nr:hypothetical protein C9I78_19220 [Vibrio parahaemolyticus]AWJ81414.1 hypothetical protein C7Y67_23925 [Vibrio parahaemolyticus]EGQ9860553.1 hypothetical protein [Vibrio parahaemolyticus]EGR2912396.1 hypothetical protein [Vibrio parahaemolyticus]EGR3151968.1 hypothetical protein [Vibrio parahaemolyticus]